MLISFMAVILIKRKSICDELDGSQAGDHQPLPPRDPTQQPEVQPSITVPSKRGTQISLCSEHPPGLTPGPDPRLTALSISTFPWLGVPRAP